MRFHSILNTSVSFGFLALCQCSPSPTPGNTGGPSTLGGAAGGTSTTAGGNASGGMASSMGGNSTMAGAAPTGAAGMTSAGGATMMGGAGATSGGASANAGMGGAGMSGAGMGGTSANAGMGGAIPMGGSGAGMGGEGGAGVGGAGEGGAGVGGAPAGGEFTLTSEELTEGESFADANTCTGGGGELDFGVSISLEWSGFPAETQSFALTMIDVTLVDGTAMDYLGCHSFFHDLPVGVTSLPAGGWTDALSDAGATVFRGGYLGPCPPNGPDTYVLTLYALPDATFTPEGNFSTLGGCNMLRESLEEAAIAQTTLSGTYIQP